MKSFRSGLLVATSSLGLFWGSVAYPQTQNDRTIDTAGQGRSAGPVATPMPPADTGQLHSTVVVERRIMSYRSIR